MVVIKMFQAIVKRSSDWGFINNCRAIQSGAFFSLYLDSFSF